MVFIIPFGGLGALFGGSGPPKAPPVATGLSAYRLSGWNPLLFVKVL